MVRGSLQGQSWGMSLEGRIKKRRKKVRVLEASGLRHGPGGERWRRRGPPMLCPWPSIGCERSSSISSRSSSKGEGKQEKVDGPGVGDPERADVAPETMHPGNPVEQPLQIQPCGELLHELRARARRLPGGGGGGGRERKERGKEEVRTRGVEEGVEEREGGRAGEGEVDYGEEVRGGGGR